MKEVISYGRFQCSELAPHKNLGMEITYIEKGRLEWMTEGIAEKVEAGSIYFTLPWQVHGSVTSKEPENTIWHVLFHLEKDYLAPRDHFSFPKSFGFSKEEMRILSTSFAGSPLHSFPATPAIRSLMPSLINELQSTHELRDAHAQTLIRAVLIELKRIISGEMVNENKYTYSEQRVQALISGLPSSCEQKWTLDKMAKHGGIQRTQLSKIFHKLTGSTPMEYLLRIRVERAKTLLRETDMKVIDIALECGFGTSQYFANTFKRATGTTPSEYRPPRREPPPPTRDWSKIQFRSKEEERQRIEEFSEYIPPKKSP